MLDSGQLSIGLLTTLAADTSFNTQHIDLVGLSLTGLEYVSVLRRELLVFVHNIRCDRIYDVDDCLACIDDCGRCRIGYC